MHAYNERFNICVTGARSSTNKPRMSSIAGAPKIASERSSAIRGRKQSKHPTDFCNDYCTGVGRFFSSKG